jgi:hypothetical protein
MRPYTELGRRQPWTQREPGARKTEPGRLGTPSIASAVSLGSWDSPRTPLRLQDADGSKPIPLRNCSCFRHENRKNYVIITSELMGATMLGALWYSEADRPEGRWVHAREIITHANRPGDAHDFYNPTRHPFLDRDGGRVRTLLLWRSALRSDRPKPARTNPLRCRRTNGTSFVVNSITVSTCDQFSSLISI